jgi:hypothetical protein
LQDSKAKERAWKEFSELALSIDRLCQEVGLSHREATKVAKSREAMEFKSQADIDRIKLAKASSKKIKDYINCQRLTAIELPGLPGKSVSRQRDANGSPPKRKRKKPDVNAGVSAELLFPERELVS